MIGAIVGDIVGSIYEFNNHRSKDFPLFGEGCFATDDSIMTIAMAKALLDCNGDYTNLSEYAVKEMQALGRPHPDCGFGGSFFESVSFEDAIRNAISIGGDSDTLAAITGGMAEAYYGAKVALF